MSRDILRVADVWATDLSPLELQNADTKRTAESGGSRRLTMSTSGQARAPLKGRAGPARLVQTKGYSTTMALSTLKKLLGKQYIRRGDGIISLPASRRKERLFGAAGAGRTKALSTGVKIEKLESDYDPREDTVLRAFVRALATRATADAEEAGWDAEGEAEGDGQ